MYVYIYMIYIYIYVCLYGHKRVFALPLGYLLFLAFRHVQNLQPLQHFVCSVNMKVAFRCSFSTFICHLHWYLQHLLLFIIRGSCSLKSSFLSCSFCVSQVTWFFPALWSSWHGCTNCFATRSPKHTISAFHQCHLQVCLWHGEKQAMFFQDFATNGRHIVCQNMLVACQKFQKHVIVACQKSQEIISPKFQEHARSVSEIPRTCYSSVSEVPRTC